MKKIFLSCLLTTASILSSSADIIYPDGSKPTPEPYALKRISKGFSNVITFAFEFPRSVFEAEKNEGIFSTEQITNLVTQGPYRSAQRLGSGLYDLGIGIRDLGSFLVDSKLSYNDYYASSWKYSNLNESSHHLEPETLGIVDLIPGYRDKFGWESIGTPAR